MSLEIIRFAASNHLCVELDYTDKLGRRATRVIEPYAFMKAKTGNVLLHAVRVESGESRIYIIENINEVKITDHEFNPRFQIELGSMISSPMSSNHTGLSNRSVLRTSVRKSKGKGVLNGPTYIYRCPFCNKVFRRKTSDSKLNPHKDKWGWNCGGRTGILEKQVN